MPTEHGEVQLGGLRREHLVAAAMVAAVVVVLGFASGLGVMDAAAATATPAAPPAGSATGQPGSQQAGPPAAGALPPGMQRPTGKPVGIRPGSQGTTGAAAGSSGFAPGFDPGSGLDSDFGGLPTGPPGVGGDPAAPPTGPVATPPQCSAGILDQLLALIAEVLGGTEPAVALAASGAVTPEPQSAGALLPGAIGVYTLLPMGDRLVPVAGLVPLLDAVDQRQDARRLENPTLRPAQPAAPPLPAPVDQVTQLATLLAPLGLAVDPTSGTADPLLAPVLGSLGCTGFAAAPLQEAPAQQAPPQEAIR